MKVPELGPGRHDMVQASDLQALREQLNGRAATLEMMVDNPLARQEARWLRSLSGEEWGERVCPECGEPDEGNDAHDGECSQIFPYLSPSELAVYKKLRPCFAEVIRRESGEEE